MRDRRLAVIQEIDSDVVSGPGHMTAGALQFTWAHVPYTAVIERVTLCANVKHAVVNDGY